MNRARPSAKGDSMSTFCRTTALMMVAILLSVDASAGGNAPTRFHSLVATASFSEDVGCTRTISQIHAIRDTSDEGGSASVTSTRLGVSITKYDLCISSFPVLTFQGEGGDFITNDLFDVVPLISAASLAPVTLPMFDWVSNTSFEVLVSLAWTGQGGLLDSHGHPQGNPGGSLSVQNNLFRDASVTVGSFEVQHSPVDVHLGALVYGQLQSVRSTVVR